MNIFNRIAMLLLSLAALVFGVVVLLLVSGLVSPASVSPGGVFLNLWRFFAILNTKDATTAALVCAIVAVVGLIVLILELLSGRQKPRDFVVKEDGLGKVTIKRTSVRDLVRYEASSMPEVIDARPVADTGPNGLRIQVQAELSPDTDAVKVAEALQKRIQQSIQHHTGLPTADIQVMTQIEPLKHTERKRVR
jgi:uncharacterized alkaline shock family protein YloU